MCDQCTSVFFKKDSLKTHIKNVHSDSPELFGEFMCDQCPKIFSKKHTLAVHRYRVHSNKYINRKPVEKVKCPQCEKTYKNHSYLKVRKSQQIFHFFLVFNSSRKNTLLCEIALKVEVF